MKRKNAKNKAQSKAKPPRVYKTIPAPKESEIIFTISLYFAVPPKFNRNNILFLYYLKRVALIHGTFYKDKESPEALIFRDWLDGKGSKLELSKQYYNHTRKGANIINKHLTEIVASARKLYDLGYLAVQEYKAPVKSGSREDRKRINALAEKMGLSFRVPLRKLSEKERTRKALKEWKKKTHEILTAKM